MPWTTGTSSSSMPGEAPAAWGLGSTLVHSLVGSSCGHFINSSSTASSKQQGRPATTQACCLLQQLVLLHAAWISFFLCPVWLSVVGAAVW